MIAATVRRVGQHLTPDGAGLGLCWGWGLLEPHFGTPSKELCPIPLRGIPLLPPNIPTLIPRHDRHIALIIRESNRPLWVAGWVGLSRGVGLPPPPTHPPTHPCGAEFLEVPKKQKPKKPNFGAIF